MKVGQLVLGPVTDNNEETPLLRLDTITDECRDTQIDRLLLGGSGHIDGACDEMRCARYL